MAMVCQCNNCKKIIGKDDIKINLIGYKVSHNAFSTQMPKGYAIGIPEDFCSFGCLAEWATEKQKMLDEYIELANKYEKGNKADLK